jgi:hypothetical protein
VQVQVSEKDIKTAKALKMATEYLKKQAGSIESVQALHAKQDERIPPFVNFGMSIGDTRTLHFYDGDRTMPTDVMRRMNTAFIAHAISLHAELTRIISEAAEAHAIKIV